MLFASRRERSAAFAARRFGASCLALRPWRGSLWPWLLLCLFPGCGGCRSDQSVEMPAEDFEVRLAMLEARDSVDQFIEALQAPQPGDQFFVKAEVRDGETSAWVWLSDVTYSGSAFTGKVSEVPPGFQAIRKDFPVTVAPGAIGDWMIVNGASRRGGFVETILQRRREEAGRS